RGLDVDVPDRGPRASYLPWRRPPGSGRRRVVTDVNLQVGNGECLALVGESGSGKSSTLAAIMDLDPRRADAARITLAGRLIQDRADVRERLHPAVQLVFQDAGAALDPRLTVAELVGEPLLVAGLPRADRTRTVRELLERVGLDAPILSRFSAQLSGGQRQRVAIARALATTPRLLLLDEPVSALDVCVQADILDLLERLRAELGLAYVFVAHDLAVVHRLADRVAVMYAGRIVETGPAQALLASPRHPYTRALVSAVPIPDPMVERSRRAIALPEPAPEPAGRGDSSAVVDDPPGSGCPVVPRCPLYALLDPEAAQTCRCRVPQLEPVALEAPGPAPASTPAEHEVACHHPAAATSLLPLSKPAGRQLGSTP
ncbi:MAG: ATP-binding cassette domain-containing protein, partial [Micrococcales bacterium]|nr:ATP-binding cassette domain-containing protein [Micrococcales bacterium]